MLLPDEIRFLVENFPDGLRALERRMAENEPRKKGKWKRQSFNEHLAHKSGHWTKFANAIHDDDNLAGDVIRGLMALQIRESSR